MTGGATTRLGNRVLSHNCDDGHCEAQTGLLIEIRDLLARLAERRG